MDPTFIMLMIILAQLIVVQAILAREIIEELFRHGTRSVPAPLAGRSGARSGSMARELSG